MASQTYVTTGNLSLLSIGSQSYVSSIFPPDGSTESNAINTLWAFVYEQLARTARWGCFKKQVNLTLLQAAQGTPENPQGTTLPIPQQPWLYAYLYPPDSLFFRQIMAPVITSGAGYTENQTAIANTVTPCVGQNGLIPYETASSQDSQGNPIEVILTNQDQAVGNYTVNQPNPQLWDSLFTSAYVASLAAYLVPALSLQPALMQQQIAIAERLIAQARAQDGNESPISQDHKPDWMRARRGSTGALLYGQPGFYAYGAMNWFGG